VHAAVLAGRPACRVRRDQPSQQVEAFGVRHHQRLPEPRPEPAGHVPALSSPLHDAVGEEAQDVQVRRRVGQALEGVGEEVGCPPAGIVRRGVRGRRQCVHRVHHVLEAQGEFGVALPAGQQEQGLYDRAAAVARHGPGAGSGGPVHGAGAAAGGRRRRERRHRVVSGAPDAGVHQGV
jgi:hypothetical protein